LYRKINSLEAIANSGVLSDREIELEHGRVGLIPETKRLQNLEDIHNKIDRFSNLRMTCKWMKDQLGQSNPSWQIKIILGEESN
jgi:predicted 3-demethylubiquinone-9 3-methyltransferase (glyoxalase superfamily)